MIKTKTSCAVGSAFLIGMGTALLIEPSQSDQTISETVSDRKISDRSPNLAQENDQAGSDRLLGEIVDSKPDEQAAQLDEIDSGDFPAVLDALSRRTGIRGLTKEEAGYQNTWDALRALNSESVLNEFFVKAPAEGD